MNLLQKGIALLSVPLLVEIGLIVILLNQNAGIDQETRQVLKSKQLIQSVYLIQAAYLDAVGSLNKFENTRNGHYLFDCSVSLNRIRILLKNVKEAAASNQMEYDVTVGKLQALATETYKTLLPFINRSDIETINRKRLKEMEHAREYVTSVMSDFARLSNALAQWQWQKERDSEERQQEMRDQIRVTLLFGLMLKVLIVLVLAAWMKKHLFGRLNTIMDNAKRIGMEMPLLARVPIQDEIGELDSVLHLVSNVLAEGREKERQTEKIKEEFYAMVTHDLRAPLTGVVAAVSLVREGHKGEISYDAKKTLELANVNIMRVSQLVDDFLDLRKLDAKSFELEFRNFQAEDLINECVESMTPHAQTKGINIIVEAGSVNVKADRFNLSRVIMNLITNAITHSPRNGEITVKLSTIENEKHIRVGIGDQGPGIPAGQKEYVFQSFKQLPGQPGQQGTGLGLAISKLIVEQHGGKIGVEDNQPKGSTFWFTIPVAPDSVE